MHKLLLTVRQIVRQIVETEEKRKRLADFVRELSPSADVIHAVVPCALKEAAIAGVDGGLVKKSLHGMDCLLVRAAAACFHYRNGRVETVDYFPSRFPTPRPEVHEALSDAEWGQFASLHRLKEEITTASQCIEQLNPDILLLDGLLLPHHFDTPARSSSLWQLYNDVLLCYKTLFSMSLKTKTPLAGIVEDSRHTIFCDYLRSDVLSSIRHDMVPELKRILKKTRDSSMLYTMLKKGERTCDFQSANPLTAEFGIPPIRTFYLKTAQFDRPLKIDYLPQTIDIDTLAGTLLSISGRHSGYGIPVPLIEADNVAKLSEADRENLYTSILTHTGSIPGTMKLRRDERPFS